jgi:predicted transcriptional regulator of viral defense system
VTDSVIGDLPETFTAAQASLGGLSRRGLVALERAGDVERVARGIYRRSSAEPVDHDLLEIAVKAHRPTLCLISALARHELTDQIPAVHDIALPRGEWRPVVSAAVRWHRFDPDTFDVGRTEIDVDAAHRIGLYDAPRSIVDAYRLRHLVGAETANEALRRWLRAGGRPALLLRCSTPFPQARSAILNALQVLL